MRATLIDLPGSMWRACSADCERRRPDEACGMLVGTVSGGRPLVREIVPMANVWPDAAERPTRYATDPLEQMRAERRAIENGWDVVGFYHSHPTGRPVPSEVDVGLAWPGYIYLIVGFTPAVEMRAWTLDETGTRFAECRIETAG